MNESSSKKASTPSAPHTTLNNVLDNTATSAIPIGIEIVKSISTTEHSRLSKSCDVPVEPSSTKSVNALVNSESSTENSGLFPPNNVQKTKKTKPESSLVRLTSKNIHSRLSQSCKAPETATKTKIKSALVSSTPKNQHSRLSKSSKVTETVATTNTESCLIILNSRNKHSRHSSLRKFPATEPTAKSESGLVSLTPKKQHSQLSQSNKVLETVTSTKLELDTGSLTSKKQHSNLSPSRNFPATKTTAKLESSLINSTSPTQHSSISPLKQPLTVSANRVVVFGVNNYIIPDKNIDTSYLRMVNKPTFGKVKTDKFPLRVCLKFNVKGGCKFLNYCNRFHVCQFWIKGNCKTDQCPLYHDFNSCENIHFFRELFSKYFGEDKLREQLKINMYHKNGIKGNFPESICLDYVLNMCERENCPFYHIKCTYSWEVKVNNEWLKFPRNQNKEIEMAFSDPTKDVAVLGSVTRIKNLNEKCKIDFNSMTLITSNGTECSVRRLSTPSDVAFFKSVATRWLWYYETKENEWKFYDNAHVEEFFVIPFSDYIETMYLKKKCDLKYSLSPYSSSYRAINFETMMDSEYPEYPGRRIKRRPYPIDPNRWEENTTFRSLWSKKEKSTVRRKVEQTSPEFHFVEKLLTASMMFMGEIHIERIENHRLWNAYQLKKSVMMHIYGNDLSKVNEQYLFHGTSKKVSEKIPTGNLDWRLHRTHLGNRYGKGAYFSNSAKISDLYALEDDDGCKYMFVVMVLIGTAVVGNREMSHPPVNPSTLIRFDSTVDGVNPSIFVKYNSDEYYPAYMVKYKT